MSRNAHDPETALASTLRFYRETLDWLAGYHADYGRVSTHDLAADDPRNAIWKLSGEAISQAVALVELLAQGFTGQTWPAMRAVHEADRLLVAVTDPNAARISRRWLVDQEVKQSEARKAEQRQAERLAEEMRSAGRQPIAEDVAQFSRQIYGGMSRAAHHRRSVVDESVDHQQRTFIYGSDPRPERRLAYALYAGALIHEVMLLVGDALSALWGPTFYQERLVPMLRRFEETLTALERFSVIRLDGLA